MCALGFAAGCTVTTVVLKYGTICTAAVRHVRRAAALCGMSKCTVMSQSDRSGTFMEVV
ncbi:hypothetical protein PR003_g7115 [Phytophthora rubi]|uniref:Uncharacterized protein n=1 Tax=Phytophthora rubi TaxID=129364 RepID=A0A6A3NF29_9STRA|nr:hypothetical protein PR002_g7085 [Phytophthora rubi]KAE9040688.1 hypothetical protein PR001_g6950 [Phytophthora rubi]KAE9347064.1 hypothetical protein PR003_g7115 [Phytophthora rubi]